MKKEFIDLEGEKFVEELVPHDISKYEVLFHVTPKSNIESIDKEGLLCNQPFNKSILETGMLFFSHPVDMNISDCFRWYNDYTIVILNAKALHEDGFKFYNDCFANGHSEKKNHICCDVDIPRKYIKKFHD